MYDGFNTNITVFYKHFKDFLMFLGNFKKLKHKTIQYKRFKETR